MKNSAWYSKLWRKKLDALPVKSDAGAAWTSMQQMLDVHLPVSAVPPAAPVAGKSLIAKIVTMAGYVLPAAAMIGTVTFFAVKPAAKQKVTVKPDRKQEYRLKADSTNNENVFNADSNAIATLNETDSVRLNTDSMATYSDVLKKDSSSIPASSNLAENNKSGNGKPAENTTALTNANATSNTSGNTPNTATHSGSKRQEPASGNNNSFATAGANNSTSRSGSNKNGKATGRRNNAGYITRIGNRANKPTEVRSGSAYKNQQGNWTTNSSNIEIPKELSNYANPTVNFNYLQNEKTAFSMFAQEAGGKSMTGNNSLLLTEDKPKVTDAGNVTKPADSKPTATKPAKNSIPKEIVTPAYNFGLEAGLNLANGTGLYGGLTADYAITNRLLIGAGLRFNGSRKLTGNYEHPSYYRPDSSAKFTITDERKISVIDVPLNLTYKVSNLISLKAGAVISFAGNPGSVTYKLGPVGSLRDTLRRSGAIDSTVNSSVLAKRVSLGFTGGVSFNVRQFSIDARYLALPAYKVSNSVGGYSQTYNPFQIGITYWLRQGAKKSPGR